MKFINIFLSLITLIALMSIQVMSQTEITGTKTVGTNGDYANIKVAFDSININGISGDVVLQITSDQTLTAPAVLKYFGLTDSITIYPTGEYQIEGTVSNDGLIQFDSCANVKLDGSLNQSGSGQALTITNLTNSGSSSRASAIKLLKGASNINITNTHIRVGDGTVALSSYLDGISYNASTDGDAPKNISIQKNLFTRGYYGIRLFGSTSQLVKNVDVLNNQFVASSSSDYLFYSSYLAYNENINIKDNTVQGYASSDSKYKPEYGLYNNYCYGDVKVQNNNINKVYYHPIYVGSLRNNDIEAIISDNTIMECYFYGIYINGDYEYDCTYNIYNNRITDINKNHSTTNAYDVYGIYLYYAKNSEIHDNYIENVSSDYDGNYAGITAGIHIYGSYYTDGRADNNKIYQNRIVGVYSKGDANYDNHMPSSILLRNANNTEIYQNTIYMNKSFTAGGVQGAKSACINILPYAGYSGAQNSSGHIIKNNVLINEMVGNGTETYAIYLGKHTYSSVTYYASIAESDYNAVSAPLGSIAYDATSSTTYAYLDAWQTAGFGEHSTDVEVELTSDGHLTGRVAVTEDLLCPILTDVSIPTDVDGETRDADNNRMGVDITAYTLELTDDLNVSIDKPDGLCDGTQNLEFVFDARGIFDDGVERNISNELMVRWYLDNTPLSEDDDNYVINSRRLNIPELSPELAGEYRAEFWTLDHEVISTSTKLITVIEPVSIVSENMVEKYTGCEGFHDLTLSVETHNDLSVQWQKEINGVWEDIEGETAYSFYLDFTALTKEEADGKYRAEIIGDELCEPKYPSVIYTDTETEVELYLPVTDQKMEYYFDNENLCGGMELEFYAEAQGSVRGYQWQKLQGGQWYDISASENSTALTQNFVIKNINETNTGAYRCKVIGNAECYDEEVFTESVDVNIPPQFELIENPESQVICGGERVEFNVIGNGLGEVKSYQWYKEGQPVTNNEFANTAMLIIDEADLSNVGEYYCEVVIEDCRGEVTYTSESAILYVLQETKITRQPVSTQVALGSDVKLSVEAHMKGLVPPYYQHDFQWFKAGVALEDDSRIQGSKSSMLTINNVEAGDFSNEYYCVVTGKCGMDETVRVSISDAPAVNITTQPMDVEVCENEVVTLEVEAVSTDPTLAITYQWFLNGAAIFDDTQINGASTNKLTITNATRLNAGVYSVKAYLANSEIATSDDAEVVINTKPEVISFTGDLSVEEEEAISLEVILANDANVTYAWYKDAAEITGANSPIFELDSATLADAGEYYCVVTNNCGVTETVKSVVTVTKKTSTSVIAENADGSMRMSNQPNPFASTTNITFELVEASNVTLTIYDAQGNEVAVIFDGMASAGVNNVDFDATEFNLSSGTYFYSLNIEGRRVSKTMILVK